MPTHMKRSMSGMQKKAMKKRRKPEKKIEKLTEICPVSTVDAKGVCTVFSEWVGVIKD